MSVGMKPECVLTRNVVYWAAKECEKQQSGEMSVAWMLDGWAYASLRRRGAPTLGDILNLGRMIEPSKNKGGIRRNDVSVNGTTMLSPALVERTLRRLIEAWSQLSAREWYREYEEIHPFIDGNGRTGSILFNWHKGVLPRPVEPPELWAQPPPESIVDYGMVRYPPSRLRQRHWTSSDQP